MFFRENAPVFQVSDEDRPPEQLLDISRAEIAC